MNSSIPPVISPSLSRRAVEVLLLAMAIATVLGLLAWGPVSLSSRMHHYADERTLWGVPHAMNVWTHVPLLPLGLWGWWRVRSLVGFDDLRRVWSLFFVCQTLATIGGMVYHLAPSDDLFVWDQMPKSAACSLMACAFLAERMDQRWGSVQVVVLAIALNILGGVWWLMSPMWFGVGDLRPLIWLELIPTLLVAAGAWSIPGRLLTRQDWMRSLASFVLAQTVDWADAPIFSTLHEVSGHSIRHLSLAICVGWIAYRLGCVGQHQARRQAYPVQSVRGRAALGSHLTSDHMALGFFSRDRR